MDRHIDTLLPIPEGKENRVVQAMRYSILGSGKALRPFLVLTIAKMLNVNQSNALNVACALEMIHTYSLIHDDLPAMDNDHLRRGKPTCHIQFDEATAILAGDALLTKAFEILSDEATHPDALIRCKLISFLSQSAGIQGMIGGQMIDLIGEKTPLSLPEIERMQSMKTGALLSYACMVPALMSNDKEKYFQPLKIYADAIGLMFQMTDDILDVEGDDKIVGKTLGKDKNAHKSTFVSTLGIDKTKERVLSLADVAIQALNPFGHEARLLIDTVHFILTRNK
ncbi:MAG: polyprenyl synthetase family protein [Alphaproteobacteria bacterium]|nr:polyprenyl synthetase family protein [Alphaproteobacteria bacterium]